MWTWSYCNIPNVMQCRGGSRGGGCTRHMPPIKLEKDFSHEIPKNISRLPPLCPIFLSVLHPLTWNPGSAPAKWCNKYLLIGPKDKIFNKMLLDHSKTWTLKLYINTKCICCDICDSRQIWHPAEKNVKYFHFFQNCTPS